MMYDTMMTSSTSGSSRNSSQHQQQEKQERLLGDDEQQQQQHVPAASSSHPFSPPGSITASTASPANISTGSSSRPTIPQIFHRQPSSHPVSPRKVNRIHRNNETTLAPFRISAIAPFRRHPVSVQTVFLPNNDDNSEEQRADRQEPYDGIKRNNSFARHHHHLSSASLNGLANGGNAAAGGATKFSVRDGPFRYASTSCLGFAKRIVENERFKVFVVLMIALNSILMGVQTMVTDYTMVLEDDTLYHRPQTMSRGSRLLERLEYGFLIFFTLELLLQWIVYGWKLFWVDGWWTFDFVVVAASWIFWFFAYPLQVCFRILRTFRLITRIRELKDLVHALLSAIPRMIGIFWFLLLVFYVFAVMFTQLFGDLFARGYTSGDYFSTLNKTCFTLTRLMTLDSWSEIVLEVMDVYRWSWVPFFCFIGVSSFVVVNLVVAVIVDAVNMAHAQQLEHHMEEFKSVASGGTGEDGANTTGDDNLTVVTAGGTAGAGRTGGVATPISIRRHRSHGDRSHGGGSTMSDVAAAPTSFIPEQHHSTPQHHTTTINSSTSHYHIPSLGTPTLSSSRNRTHTSDSVYFESAVLQPSTISGTTIPSPAAAEYPPLRPSFLPAPNLSAPAPATTTTTSHAPMLSLRHRSSSSLNEPTATDVQPPATTSTAATLLSYDQDLKDLKKQVKDIHETLQWLVQQQKLQQQQQKQKSYP